MQINKISDKILTNKYLLKGLEKISEHGTSFAAGTSLVLSTGLRTFSISKTPDIKEENKSYAMANSVSSGLIKFAIVEAVALPIESAVKRIDKNSGKYLSSDLKSNSRSYKFITQAIKLSTGLITAIPKSVMTVALIPVFMDKLILRKKTDTSPQKKTNQITNTPSFTGIYGEKLSKGLARIIDNKKIQNIARKYQSKDEDIFKNITAATDILLTSSSVYQINKSKDIHENSKKALIYNNIISTAITVIGGYKLDSIIKNKTAKFTDVFKKANATNPKLTKYIEGLNIVRPALIFAGIYYGILPIFSTYISDKIDRYAQKGKTSQTLTK